MSQSLGEAFGHDDSTTVEIDAKHAHRAWAFLNIMIGSDDHATYPADTAARDALAEALIEAGELSEDRL